MVTIINNILQLSNSKWKKNISRLSAEPHQIKAIACSNLDCHQITKGLLKDHIKYYPINALNYLKTVLMHQNPFFKV